MWPIVFGLALLADIVTTMMAIRRGLTEGNPILSGSPVILMLAFSALVVIPAELYRHAGASGWEWIYAIGAAVHLVAAAWNTVLILRRK